MLLRAAELRAERPDGFVDDVHFPESLASAVIEDASRPGDLVLDPFAGYGTSLAVAARLGRRAVGVELLADHLEVARRRVPPEVRVLRGDARRLGDLVTEPVDLVLTSPPYMTSVSHPENPLTGYATDDGDYATYLQEIADVFAHVANVLRPGGQVVINVANLAVGDHVTPLAWDVARAVSRHLRFRGETFLCWDEHPPGFTGDYLLWFDAPKA